MDEQRLEVLKAYRDTSIYTVNALKVAIDDIEQSLASNVYDAEIKGLMQERLESLQSNLDIIELDPE